MAKAEEVNRSYSGSDADMVQASRVMHGLFTEDKSAFTNFDLAFSDPFGENWLQKIEAANAVVRDTLPLGELTEFTKRVADKMEECKEFFQTLKYFVEKAFPKKKEIWTQFAFSDFDIARRSETKMIQLFGIIDKSAKEYKNQLIAAGFGQDKIDQIQALQTELIAADYDQEISKKKRPAITQERVLILNECFGFMQRAGKAGKIIFKSNYAKYNQYLLPSESEEKKAEEPVTPQAS